MDIKIKYNVGQKVYFVFKGVVSSGTIELIDINISKRETEIIYDIFQNKILYGFCENEIFASKKALINYLKNGVQK